MYAVDTDLTVWALEELWSRGFEFDGVWIWGDVAYRSGPFMSPRMYRELVMPHHKRVTDVAHLHGCKVIYHGCGNNNLLVPLFIEAGIDCLQPMEVKAGMDVRELKRDYGDKLSFMGNIDARLYQTNDRDALAEELRNKISVAKQGGGYIYHSDHSIPPGTSLETYRFALECVEEFGRY
jgi:uroporphyrinogen decarboxylase